MNVEWKMEKAEYAEFNGPTCGNVAVWRLCRERQAAWKSQSWRSECNLFGSMPWRLCPSHKHLPGLAQKIHESTFTSLFSTKVIYAGLPRKAFLWNRPLQTSVFFCGCASNSQDSSKGQPKGPFQMNELNGTIEPIAQMNVEWKMEKAEYAEFNGPTCGNIAVWRLCRERQAVWKSQSWRSECNLFGSMPWRLCQWHKHLPGLAQKIHESTFTSLFSTKVIYAGLPRKAFLWNRPLQTSVFFRGCASNSQVSSKASPRAIFKWTNLIVNGDFQKMQGRARGCKGERKTYCMYIALYIISATDLPNKHSCAQARARASIRGSVHLKNNRAFGRPAKETVFGTAERKSCWTTSSNWSYGPYEWKVGKAEFAEIWWVQCANSGQHCSLSAVQRKKSHDGLNLTCLDQSHGVGSHDTSSSQGWRKRIVVESTIYI